jgi:hypothetical protein
MGVDSQPLSPVAENRTDSDCHPDAANVEGLRHAAGSSPNIVISITASEILLQ